MKYDVVIIGGASAGLTAALYSARRALKTLVISKNLGGQAAITTEIENYPGTGAVPGPILMMKFKEQAEKAGAEIKIGEVSSIEKKDNRFLLKSPIGDFEALTVILAFGLEHRKLNVPGEAEFISRGVAYCATCDGPLFKNKIVAVVGAGNSAFDAADYLASLCEKVYLLARNDEYKAEQVLIDAVKNNPKIEVMNFTEITEISGDKKVEKVKIKNNQTGQEAEVALNGVFIEIGWQTQTGFIKDLVKLDERGYVIVDKEAKTSLEGLFAAGDVTDSTFKQVVISAGEGAKAALSAARYIQKIQPSKEERQDWTRRKGSKLS
jgi:thioredoxin-disulfide reductase